MAVRREKPPGVIWTSGVGGQRNVAEERSGQTRAALLASEMQKLNLINVMNGAA